MFTTRRRLRTALRDLADACAQTLPGSAWSDEIDEAIQQATELVGPMAETDVTQWAADQREQREFQAWSDGYHLGENEVEEFIADKDAFIAKQAAILVDLVAGNHIKWEGLTEGLQDELADYV